METIIKMYVSLAPSIFSGIMNMIWCKAPVFLSLNKPIDSYKTLPDSRRIFGDNKTWKGFVGYIQWSCLFTVLWGAVCSTSSFLTSHNYLYVNYENRFFYNIAIGASLGLAYSLFELPNSFLKRRLGIDPGLSTKGSTRVFFVFLDQADSIIGCVLVLSFVYKMSAGLYLLYVMVGSITHILINIMLYFFKMRRNMF